MAILPKDRVKRAWSKLTYGPGWEKRLSALMVEEIEGAARQAWDGAPIMANAELNAVVWDLQQIASEWATMPTAADMEGMEELEKLDSRMSTWFARLETALEKVAVVAEWV